MAQLQRQIVTTTIYVTHDQVEAMMMGSKVAVLRDGLLQQVDTPQNLYDHPANAFVASFIGSPSMNLYPGRVDPGRSALMVGDQALLLNSPGGLGKNADLVRDSGEVVIGIRPELLAYGSLDDQQRGPVPPSSIGSLSSVARLSPQCSVKVGDIIDVAVAVDELQLFDSQSGASLRVLVP